MPDWSAWMAALGGRVRRVREFVGLSQEQLARAAGVSQGAIIRLELAKGLATPLLVAVKVWTALAAALRTIDPAHLSDEARTMVAAAGHVVFTVDGAAPSLTADPALDELLRLYRAVPKRQREALLAVVRAAAGLAGIDDTKWRE